MNGTILVTNIEITAAGHYLEGQVKKSYYGQKQGMLFSYGEGSVTIRDNKELIALFSGTKVRINHRPLSHKLAKSLISASLVKGITPMFVRRRSGAEIPDIVFSWRDGVNVEKLKVD